MAVGAYTRDVSNTHTDVTVYISGNTTCISSIVDAITSDHKL